MNEKRIRLDEKYIRLIENILSRGDRIEIIPTKERFKVLIIKREEVKPKVDN